MRKEDQLQILEKTTPKNVILRGEKGLGKYYAARKLAAAWLRTKPEELEISSDFLLIEQESGCIRSEKAESIQRKAMFRPDIKSICIVRDAQLMTMDLQNKLLKVLEDNTDNLAVIFVTTGPLLETVTSRCVTVPFFPESLKDFYDRHKKAELAHILAADGCEGIYEKIVKDPTFSVYLSGFFHAFCGIKERENLRQLLPLTHSLKEKDPDYLPDKLELWQMEAFLHMLEHLFFRITLKNEVEDYKWMKTGPVADLYRQEEAEEAYYAIGRALEQSKKKGAFTKNDFFGLLINLIP